MMKKHPTLMDRLPDQLKNVEAPPVVWFELMRLYDDVDKLRAALKPFADAHIGGMSEVDDRRKAVFGTTFGDFRTAHDTLYPPKVG